MLILENAHMFKDHLNLGIFHSHIEFNLQSISKGNLILKSELHNYFVELNHLFRLIVNSFQRKSNY